MSTCIYDQELHKHLDRACLKKCLKETIKQIDRGEEEIFFIFGNVEVVFNYKENDIGIVV